MDETLAYALLGQPASSRAKLTFFLGIGSHPLVSDLLAIIFFFQTRYGPVGPDAVGYLLVIWTLLGGIFCPVVTVACGAAIVHRDENPSDASRRLVGWGILASLAWPLMVMLAVLVLANA